jgi:exodeoxyribonuclease VII small subunit
MPKARLPAAAPPALPLPDSYESALTELEQLLSGLDAGQLPLEQLLAQYQRGAQLLHFCRDRLKTVEDQIKVLEDGELTSWTPN